MALADDLLAVLNDPTHMWLHALRQLSADSRRLFLNLALLPNPVSADALQIAYTAPEIARVESFLDSLRSIEDSFVKIEQHYFAEERLVEFRNPSLQDFAYMYLDENTEVLGMLLSRPVFFEQIIGVFALAMAHSGWIYKAADRSKRRGEPKYAGIKRWVERRYADLIGTAIELLDSDISEVYRYIDRSRLSQLFDVITNYGLSDAMLESKKLQEIVIGELNPKDRWGARVVVRLVDDRSHRRMLDRIIHGNSALTVRRNVVDKDDWKFEILGKLDVMLELDREETWNSWGESYVDYAREWVEQLSESGDTDDDDISKAIKEITEISDLLDVDMTDELTALEDRRASLASGERGDYDETQDDSSQSSGDESEDAALELGRIFATLL